jgi:hypothetical protein
VAMELVPRGLTVPCLQLFVGFQKHFAMNATETRAFFRPLGWKLEPADPESIWRWNMISELEGDSKLELHFKSLSGLWRYWRNYTRSVSIQDPLLDYFVEQYSLGDENVQRSIMDWLIHCKRGNPAVRTKTGRLWRQVIAIEAEVLQSLTQWRQHLEKLLRRHPNLARLPYIEFNERLDRSRIARRSGS